MQFDLGTVTVLKTVTGQPASQRRFRLTDNARVYNGMLFKILQNILQGMCVSAVLLLCVNDYDNDNNDYDMT